MRCDKVIVVPRAIKVHGKEIDTVEAILLTVCLKLNKEHLLSQPIGSIGLLGVPIPEVFLLEGNRGELGVGADGAHLNELHDAMKPCFLDELNAHDGIVVEEGTGVQPVGSNAAYNGCKVDDDVRMQVVKHASYLGTITKIIVMVSEWDDLGRPVLLQFLDEVSAQEAPATRDNDLSVGEIEHSYFVSFRTLSPV
jgi:hypothetical protein